MSFVFLGSSHPLDVTAGAAGFIAGSVLVAAGLVSISIQRTATRAALRSADFAPLLDAPRWLSHFRANRENRPEPDWTAPITLSDAVRRPCSGRSNNSSSGTEAGRPI